MISSEGLYLLQNGSYDMHHFIYIFGRHVAKTNMTS